MPSCCMLTQWCACVDQCSDNQQLLYPACSGIDSNSLMKCNGTVLDIFSDTSLCCQHSSETAANAPIRRKALHLQPRTAHKKLKMAVAKRKGQVKVSRHLCRYASQLSSVASQLKLRADGKLPPLGASFGWSSKNTVSSDASLPAAEGKQPA